MVKKVRIEGVEIELSSESEFDKLIPFSDEEYELIYYNSALIVLYDLQIDCQREIIPNGIEILCNLLEEDAITQTQVQLEPKSF